MSESLICANDKLILEPEGGWEFKVGSDAEIVLKSQQSFCEAAGNACITEADLMAAARETLGRAYTKAPYDKSPGILGDAVFELEGLSKIVTVGGSPAATKATEGKATIKVMVPALDNSPPGGAGPHPEPILKAKWTLEPTQEIASAE